MIDLSVRKFLQLTMLLAVGSAAAPGCTIEETAPDNAAGASNANSAGRGSAGEESTGGTSEQAAAGAGGEAGLPSDEGLSGGAGSPSDEGLGGAGSPSDEGTSGSAGVANAAGQGGGAGQEGVAGGANVAGQANAAGQGGGAGASNVEGQAGKAGEAAAGAAGAPACVSGDPAEEGGGLDCTTLSYAEEACTDPAGEQTVPYGVRVCQRYAGARVGSAAVLFECLSGLSEPAEGWCGAAHRDDVDQCVSTMEARTCTAPNAQTVCEATHAGCDGVDVEECVLDVGPLPEETWAELATCVTTDTSDFACRGDYMSTCLQLPDRPITSEEGCAFLREECSELTEDACMAGMAAQTESGWLPASTLRMIENFCMMDYENNQSMNCAEAWTACTTS
jgi:hypothetical protein